MPPWGKKHETLQVVQPVMPSTAKCCGRSDFILGALSFGVRYEPASGFYERAEGGCIVACCHCGRKLGINSEGTYMPHEDAMPGPWALERVRQRGDETKPQPNKQRVALRKPPAEA